MFISLNKFCREAIYKQTGFQLDHFQPRRQIVWSIFGPKSAFWENPIKQKPIQDKSWTTFKKWNTVFIKLKEHFVPKSKQGSLFSDQQGVFSQNKSDTRKNDFRKI